MNDLTSNLLANLETVEAYNVVEVMLNERSNAPEIRAFNNSLKEYRVKERKLSEEYESISRGIENKNDRDEIWEKQWRFKQDLLSEEYKTECLKRWGQELINENKEIHNLCQENGVNLLKQYDFAKVPFLPYGISELEEQTGLELDYALGGQMVSVKQELIHGDRNYPKELIFPDGKVIRNAGFPLLALAESGVLAFTNVVSSIKSVEEITRESKEFAPHNEIVRKITRYDSGMAVKKKGFSPARN